MRRLVMHSPGQDEWRCQGQKTTSELKAQCWTLQAIRAYYDILAESVKKLAAEVKVEFEA